MIAYFYMGLILLSSFYFSIKKPIILIFLYIIFLNFGESIISFSNQQLFDIYPLYLNLTLYTSIFMYAIYYGRIEKILFHKINIIILITIVFLLFLALFHNVEPSDYITAYRRNLSQFIIIPFIFSLDIQKEDYQQFLKFITTLLIINIIVGLIQYFLPANIYHYLFPEVYYERYGSFRSFTDKFYKEFGLIKGTFLRMNDFANYIVILSIVILVSIKHLNIIKISNKYLSILMILSLLVVFLSGNRISLVSFLFGIFFFYSIKRKINFIFGTLIIIGSIFFYSTIIPLIRGYIISSFDISGTPFERVFFLLDYDLNYLFNNSTLFLSIILIPFFSSNILFGAGNLFKGGYSLITPQSGNTTDATFLLTLAEYGVIGFVFMILPYIYLLIKVYKLGSKEYKFLIILFMVLCVQMITDAGLFMLEGSFLFFTIASFMIKLKQI